MSGHASWGAHATPLPPVSLRDVLDPGWASRVNARVEIRFGGLLWRLRPTTQQVDEGLLRAREVVETLNRHYRGVASYDHGMMCGAWLRDTHVRPPRDLDIQFILPGEVAQRYSRRPGNAPSALLQEVRAVLQERYPRSDIRGAGPVVSAAFGDGHGVELVPVFQRADGTVLVPDTKDGGSFRPFAPLAQLRLLEERDRHSGGNARRLARLVKRWQAHCNVPLASFEVELLVCDFIASYSRPNAGLALFDYVLVAFFSWLAELSDLRVFDPGYGVPRWLGSDWRTRAQTAARVAAGASELEVAELHDEARGQWQRLFGVEVL